MYEVGISIHIARSIINYVFYIFFIAKEDQLVSSIIVVSVGVALYEVMILIFVFLRCWIFCRQQYGMYVAIIVASYPIIVTCL